MNFMHDSNRSNMNRFKHASSLSASNAEGNGENNARRGLRAHLAALVLLIGLPLLSCTSQGETAEAQIIDSATLNLTTLAGLYIFDGEIDSDLTSSCGTATASTTGTSSGSSDSSSSGSSSGSDNATTFDISSFYTFQQGQTMQLKYQYFTTRGSFSLSPTNSTITTCATQDFVSCDTTGSFTCETEDGSKCGGTRTFIFVDTIAGVRYQGSTGTINWEDAFSLNEGNSAVSLATLNIEMVSSAGVAFKGRVRCVSSEL